MISVCIAFQWSEMVTSTGGRNALGPLHAEKGSIFFLLICFIRHILMSLMQKFPRIQ